MTFQPHGKHLIAGNWVVGGTMFTSSPAEGPTHGFSTGTSENVDAACQAAEAALWSYGYSSREGRAAFLDRIADEIEARADAITEIGTQETGLPTARLQGERGRTTGQLRLFAGHILKGDCPDVCHDPALSDRKPLPRPDLKMVQRPIGPVAVFGASYFPLAVSAAGGDTAAALASGCPVVVNGHPAHPGPGEIVAGAFHAAIQAIGIHAGVFSLIQGDKHDLGTSPARHPLVRAVGFTGSPGGGRALFDLCAQRPGPMPFFGEPGSVNPMFLLPNALAARGTDIGTGWAGSLTMGAGRFCTNPGIAIVIDGPEADALLVRTKSALGGIGPQTMLNDGIAQAYRDGQKGIAASDGVRDVLTSMCDRRQAAPYPCEIDAATWLADHAPGEEVLGPPGLVVRVAGADQMTGVAHSLQGQMTCTLHMDEPDTALAKRLMPVLESKVGRLLVNGFPTGVEVADSLVHGGPYPASTNFGATSAGTLSSRRFLRPVCYQNMPDAPMPN